MRSQVGGKVFHPWASWCMDRKVLHGRETGLGFLWQEKRGKRTFHILGHDVPTRPRTGSFHPAKELLPPLSQARVLERRCNSPKGTRLVGLRDGIRAQVLTQRSRYPCRVGSRGGSCHTQRGAFLTFNTPPAWGFGPKPSPAPELPLTAPAHLPFCPIPTWDPNRGASPTQTLTQPPLSSWRDTHPTDASRSLTQNQAPSRCWPWDGEQGDCPRGTVTQGHGKSESATTERRADRSHLRSCTVSSRSAQGL